MSGRQTSTSGLQEDRTDTVGVGGEHGGRTFGVGGGLYRPVSVMAGIRGR